MESMYLENFNMSTANLNILPRSLVCQDGVEYGLIKTASEIKLAVLTEKEKLKPFEGERTELAGKILLVGLLNPQNADALRAQLNWLLPSLLGLHTSVGMGDRIGLATPGHVRAIRTVGGKIAPIFAQQSIREMTRTGRTPRQVMDDATWGIFSESWRAGYGADADHLKTTEDIDICLSVGYSFFTIDPGAFVENKAETLSLSQLQEMAENLPVEVRPRASGLLGKTFDFEGLTIIFNESALLKAAVKYGKAVSHVAAMYNHLVQTAGQRLFEFEVSVDETDQPTSHLEHVYIVNELKRLGVKWISLAPRFVGRFEKGVDYIGDVVEFEADIAGHAAIARQLGPYKLSLHSGSDKFSIYPAAMRQTRGLVHLKTAGTSYLEALRTIAAIDGEFFRQIYSFSRSRFNSDKVSYHISADLRKAPLPDQVADLPKLLDQFDAREILHVTFGSVLTDQTSLSNQGFYSHLIELLKANSEAYAENLIKHFQCHMNPFLQKD
jgi:hypothetical protein